MSAEALGNATLICNVSGVLDNTTIMFQWKGTDMLVIQGENLSMYEISSVGVSDAGMYTCEVTFSNAGNSAHTNFSGSGSVYITLSVTSK